MMKPKTIKRLLYESIALRYLNSFEGNVKKRETNNESNKTKSKLEAKKLSLI